MLVGLGALGTASGGCDDFSSDSDEGSGGYSDSAGTGWSATASYGSPATGGWSTSTATGWNSTASYGSPATGGWSTSSTGIPECSAFEDDGDCGTCLSAACCDEGVACDDSPDCIAVQACLDACADDDLACATGCQEANPPGFALYQSLFQCADASCPGCIEP